MPRHAYPVGSASVVKKYGSAALRGEVIIMLGYTEPDSGSDVTAAKTSSRTGPVSAPSIAARRDR